MSKKDKHFLNLTEIAAHTSDMRHKLSAILVFKRTVLSVGYNRHMGMELQLDRGYGQSYSIHAEVDAFRKAVKVYPEVWEANSGLTLYVTRKGFKMAKPCDLCLKFLKKTPVNRIVYTTGFGNESVNL